MRRSKDLEPHQDRNRRVKSVSHLSLEVRDWADVQWLLAELGRMLRSGGSIDVTCRLFAPHEDPDRVESP